MMPTYQDFMNRLLPGKYALTKSMELTKVNSSGTLWYTKKFLVWYYFVFLSNDIETREYLHKAVQYFDQYIESLDPAVQESARAFFYPEIDAINLKSAHFMAFSVFAGKTDFRTQEEKTEYFQRAKKCYFTLLMDSGGQKGVKKYIKDTLRAEGFVYSTEEMPRIILDGAIDTVVRECNEKQEKSDKSKESDNSVKYLLSSEAIRKIEALAQMGRPLTQADVREIVAAYPKANPKYSAIENDMVAFLRNERQILYYYGFFHSKSSGATDYEFSSLTPVGELALRANSIEFQAVWEHQKIKMISQPATADIQNLLGLQVDPQMFAISFTPYLNILRHLAEYGDLTLDQYKYIVSRKDRTFTDEQWREMESGVLNKIGEIAAVVQAFGRQGDTRDEDFRKELLKYLLGIRGDLRMDQGSNILSCCSYGRGPVHVSDADKLALLCRMYAKLTDYKVQKYLPLFLRCEEDLRRRYTASVAGTAASVDGKVKIDWDLFNIHIDKFILLGVLVLIAALAVGIRETESLTREEVERITTYIVSNCPSCLSHLGLRSAAARREIAQVLRALSAEDYTNYLETAEEREIVSARYRSESTQALFRKIEAESARATVAQEQERTRNMALVSCMKSYYMARFMENSALRCECCGEETFMTESGEPYVEFHHLIPFRIAFGPDHYLNLFALCPNCHRKIHFLQIDSKRGLYERLSANNHLRILFTNRLLELKSERLLRSYHLEYLLADKAITQDEYDSVVA